MIERIESELRGREAAMKASIAKLVDVNSYTENRAGCDRVGDLLAELLGAIPTADVRFVASERFARHVVATFGAKPPAPSIAIVGHHDTVFPPGTFEGYREEGGIARGPGVLDMKGGLVLAIEAVRAAQSAGALDGLGVRFVIVSDEEVGSPDGARVLREHCAGASAALVLEAGRKEDRIIVARKGTGSAKVTARGVAAHAGNAHKEGKNAIWALARFVDRAQRITDYARGVTVNVGKITGGQSKNTVPELAEAWLDFRFEKVADADATRAAFEEAMREAEREVPGTTLAIEAGGGRLPLERTDANVALAREYGACAKAAGLGSDEAALVGGGSDASTTSAMGIPSIDGMGPRGSGFHTKEELIEVATLVPKAIAIARFLAGRAARA